MILRRITNAFRKQDWFTVLIETLIVVLGVFLGIQLGNWNDDRILKSGAAQAREALVDDLRRDIAVFNVRQEFYSDVLVASLNTDKKLALPPSDDLDVEWKFIVDVHAAGFMWPLEASGLVYKELKNAGTLGLIAGPSLQNDLRDYYEDASAELGVTIRFESDYRQNSRRLIEGSIHVHIAEKCDGFTLEPSTPLAYESQYYAKCPLPNDAANISSSYQRIFAETELRDDLRLRISEVSQTLSFLSFLESQANDQILELESGS
jgi:hypothetical protein